MHARWVRIVFVVHGIVTAVAAVALFIAPQAIPAVVGIALPPEANLIAYLLGAVELAIAVLSVATAWITDAVSVRVIALVFVIMHVVTAIAEIVVVAQGASGLIWVNVAFRIVVAGIFAFIAGRRPRAVAS